MATLALARVSTTRFVDQALIEITAAGRLGQPLIGGHRGQHPRLELGRIGDDEPPARLGRHRAAEHLRDLQRTAATGRPAPGDHAGRHVLGPEPAAADPLIGPAPAVRGEQPGQFLVRQQRLDRRMVELGQLPLPGAGRVQAGGVQRPEQFGWRVGVEGGQAQGRHGPRRAAPPAPPAGRRTGAAGRAGRSVVDHGTRHRTGARGDATRPRSRRRRTRRRATTAAARADRSPPPLRSAADARRSPGPGSARSTGRASRVGCSSSTRSAGVRSQNSSPPSSGAAR